MISPCSSLSSQPPEAVFARPTPEAMIQLEGPILRVTTIHATSSTARIAQKSGLSDGLVVIFRFSSFRLLSPHNVAVHRSVLLPGLFLHSQAYNSSIRCTVRSFNAALICAMNTCTSSGFQFSTRTSKPRSAASKSSSKLIRKIPPTCF